DDFVKVDPSFNTFCAFRGVTGQDMRQLMSTLFDPAFKNMNYEISFGDYYKVTDDAQQLFSNKDMDEQYEYDIITESYDCPPISYIFQISILLVTCVILIIILIIFILNLRQKSATIDQLSSETRLLGGITGSSSWTNCTKESSQQQ
ncbi:MAG: hypothetical protein EZS28_033478, partial [Streblomastix strix]